MFEHLTRYNAVNNFHSAEIRHLSRFIRENQLIIKKADKNMGLTAMPLEWYDTNVWAELSNTKYYEKIDKFSICLVIYAVKSAVDKQRPILDPYDYRIISNFSGKYKVPEFYGIPKIHKDPIILDL